MQRRHRCIVHVIEEGLNDAVKPSRLCPQSQVRPPEPLVGPAYRWALKMTIPSAVYMRSPTNEGLNQEFNSLFFQFKDCAGYVASQKQNS